MNGSIGGTVDVAAAVGGVVTGVDMVVSGGLRVANRVQGPTARPRSQTLTGTARRRELSENFPPSADASAILHCARWSGQNPATIQSAIAGR